MNAQSHGLVERLRNGGQPDLADMAYGLEDALDDILKWLAATPEGHETVPPDSIARARAALAKAGAA